MNVFPIRHSYESTPAAFNPTDGVAAERTTLPGREERLVGLAAALVEPCA